MKAFKSGIIGLMMLAGTAVTAFAGQERLEGGHDGGGGSLVVSTPEEVRAAIKWAMAEVAEGKGIPTGHGWLYEAAIFGSPVEVKINGKTENLLMCFFTKGNCGPEGQAVDEFGFPKITRMNKILAQSKVIIRNEGPCPAADKANAAASVSAYKIGADLCFSVSELRKTPAAALKMQVAALLAHELAHLLGYEESVAEQVQYGVMFSFVQKNAYGQKELRDQLVSTLWFARHEIERAKENGYVESLTPMMFTLGTIYGRLSTLLSVLTNMPENELVPSLKPEMANEVYEAVKKPYGRIYLIQGEVQQGRATTQMLQSELELVRQEFEQAVSLLEAYWGVKAFN